MKPASLQIERKQEPITNEFPSLTYDVYTLGYFRPSFAVKTTLSRPHIFSMGENKDGRKKGQILKQWTYTGNGLQRETNMAPEIPKEYFGMFLLRDEILNTRLLETKIG